MRHALPTGLLAVAMLAGCQKETELPAYELLSPRDQLIRLSMDLRGLHPSEADLWRFENSDSLVQEAMYADYVDAWLAEPEFIGRVKEIFNQRYLMRTGQVYFDTADIPEASAEPLCRAAYRRRRSASPHLSRVNSFRGLPSEIASLSAFDRPAAFSISSGSMSAGGNE